MREPRARLSEVTKRFASASDRRPAVDAVSLSFEPGVSCAVIGRNGAGKSTLLGLIAGVHTPSTGRIERTARCASLLELGAGFHPDLTGHENLELGLALAGVPRRGRASRRSDILEFAGLGDALDLQVKHFSSGMVGRLAAAVAVHAHPELLLVDEVLAVGDSSFQRAMLRKVTELRDEGCAVVLVTHSPELAAAATTRTVWLDQGRVVDDGPSAEVLVRYEAAIRGWARSASQPPVEIERVRIEPSRIEPSDPISVVADLHCSESCGPIDVRLEVRPIVGDDIIWMREADETPEMRFLNLVASSYAARLGTLDPGPHRVVIDVDAVPISPTALEVSVVLVAPDRTIIDELGSTLHVGDVLRRPRFDLRATCR